MTAFAERQRRLLAARGIDPRHAGRAYNAVDTKATPETVADWEGYLGTLDTPEKFTAAFNDGSFKNSLQGYVTAQNKERTDITAQVSEQVQAAMADFLKNNKGTGAAKHLNLDIANHLRYLAPSLQFFGRTRST